MEGGRRGEERTGGVKWGDAGGGRRSERCSWEEGKQVKGIWGGEGGGSGESGRKGGREQTPLEPALQEKKTKGKKRERTTQMMIQKGYET